MKYKNRTLKTNRNRIFSQSGNRENSKLGVKNNKSIESPNKGWQPNPRISRFSGAVAAILLLAILAAGIVSSTPTARAEESPLPTPTVKLSKEYVYAGSRMLAIEDYGIAPTPTPTPTP